MWKVRSNSIPGAAHGSRLCLMKSSPKTPSPTQDGKGFSITAALLSRLSPEQSGRNTRPTSSALLVNPKFGRLFAGGWRSDRHPDSLQKPALRLRTPHIKKEQCGVSLSPTSRRWPPYRRFCYRLSSQNSYARSCLPKGRLLLRPGSWFYAMQRGRLSADALARQGQILRCSTPHREVSE